MVEIIDCGGRELDLNKFPHQIWRGVIPKSRAFTSVARDLAGSVTVVSREILHST